jgi:DNA-binding transcriptional LysR family regulator
MLAESRRDRIDETLISLPTNESIARNFQAGLSKLGVDWFPGIEVSSLDVLEAYVRNGYGVGLTVIVPKLGVGEGVRLLPLPEFPLVSIGALWQGKLTPMTQAFLNELQDRAKLLTA